MSETRDFELPKPTEKLSLKFIMDAYYEDQKKGTETAELIPLEINERSPSETQRTTDFALSQVTPTDSTPSSTPQTKASLEISQPELPIKDLEPFHQLKPMEPLHLEEGKKYYRIGEVSSLIGVEPYVLRYWETEFAVIRPSKESGGRRVYSRKDVEALHIIRHLLHVEKYSIKGAIKRFKAYKKELKTDQNRSHSQLKALAGELRELIQMIKSLN